MRDIEKVEPRHRQMIELLTEAYLYGAADAVDFYLYTSQYMENVKFDEVEKLVNFHFGQDLNLSQGAPEEATLH